MTPHELSFFRKNLRRRLQSAAKETEREFIKYQRRADEARERWALLFQAFSDATKFNPDKEVD